jgi:hypothetical protein
MHLGQHIERIEVVPESLPDTTTTTIETPEPVTAPANA